MSNKGPSPKADGLRAMREARYAERSAPRKTPREPETKASMPIPEDPCGAKERAGGTGTCQKQAGHQGRHKFGE